MNPTTANKLADYIRNIPDFPKQGIQYKDITPLLASPAAMRKTIDEFASRFKGSKIDTIIAAEARGFIFAAPLAIELNVGFVPVRKPGKLPSDTVAVEYELEYGTDRLEMHKDALQEGNRVLLLDDVLATGGTMKACCDLVTQSGCQVVACTFLIELVALNGRQQLDPHEVHSLVQF